MNDPLTYEIHHIKDGFIEVITCEHIPAVKDIVCVNGDTYEVIKRLWFYEDGIMVLLRVFVEELKH